MNVRDRYLIEFNKFSLNNVMFGKLTFHAIFGAKFRHMRIKVGKSYQDARFHVFYMAPKATGKTSAADVFTPIADDIGLSIRQVDTFTDPALAGSMNQTTVEDPNTKQIMIRNTPTEGVLHNTDVLHVDEGKSLFINNKHSEASLIYIQKACNSMHRVSNTINRALGAGEVGGSSETTLIITAAKIRNKRMIRDMMFDGFLDRLAFYPRYMSETRKDEMTRKVIDSFYYDDKPTKKRDINPEFQMISAELEEIYDYYKDEKEIPMDPSTNNYLQGRYNTMLKYIEDNIGNRYIAREIKEYTTRYMVMTAIISTHNAMIHRRRTVILEDMKYAWKEIIFPMFKSVSLWIEQNLPDIDNDVRKVHEDNTPHHKLFAVYDNIWSTSPEYSGIPKGYISRKEIIDHSKRLTGWSAKWTGIRLRELVSAGTAKQYPVKTERGKPVYYIIFKPETHTEAGIINTENQFIPSTNQSDE